MLPKKSELPKIWGGGAAVPLAPRARTPMTMINLSLRGQSLTVKISFLKIKEINKKNTSLLAEVSHDEAKMIFLPRRERPLLAGKKNTFYNVQLEPSFQ